MNQTDWNSQFEPFYQTGSTRPPKNRNGLVAVVLVGVILLFLVIAGVTLLTTA